MSFTRIKALAKKEFKHLIRDIRMLLLLLLFPAFLLIVFGYAITFNVKDISLAVYDQEKSDVSREFINSLTSSEYFKLVKNIDNEKEIKSLLENKEAQVVAVIPYDLSHKFYSKQDVQIQFLIDGVDGNTATIIKNYVNSAVINFNFELSDAVLAKLGIKRYYPLELSPQFWYNPDLDTTRFLLPGLIAMILVITAVISVSLSLVREKERGTIEQINVSSIKTLELLLGKTAPYVVLSLINAALILIVGYILFDVAVQGSYLMLFITTIIFLFASTSIGIFVSVVSDSQQVAFSMATFASLLPSVILSGFIFPIESMPWAIQVITNITPAKFYLVILRAIILRGAGLESYWIQIIFLLIFAGILLLLSNLILKRKEKAA